MYDRNRSNIMKGWGWWGDSYLAEVTLTWTNISVTVQIPVRWELRHLVGVFTGSVADFL